MITSYLTSPNAQKTQCSYRYMVEMVSHELELDSHGIPVPKDCQTVDVMVTESGPEALTALLMATGWLDGYCEFLKVWPQDQEIFPKSLTMFLFMTQFLRFVN